MKKVAFIFCLLVLSNSCSKNDDSTGGGNSNDNFNREAVLNNWVNNYIKPALDNFSVKLSVLKTSETEFIANPNEANLVAIQSALFATQKAWQHVAMFNFGKAEELDYRNFMNTYPVDFLTTADNSQEDDNTMTSNIQAENLPIADIDFTLEKRNNEQGLPAVDYMVNGLANSNAEILEFYTTNTIHQNYKDYLKKVVDRMVDLTNNVEAYWDNNGASVIANSGSSDTASFDKMVNDFLNYTEQSFREAKVATPSGKRNGIEKPEAVESFYSSKNSKALFLEAYTAIQNIYYGNSFTNNSTNGQGIDDYLIALNATVFDTDTRETKQISDLILTYFNAIEAHVETLNSDFVQQIETNNLTFLETFNRIQKFVTLFKTNAFSAMNIRVDFVDGDGD